MAGPEIFRNLIWLQGEKSDSHFDEAFKFVLPGYNVRPLEMSGAIGIQQLKKLPSFITQRRENAKLFQDLFHDHSSILIQQEVGQSSWFGFSMVIKEGAGFSRSELCECARE